MSLRVWLPLNGTLENKGLDNISLFQLVSGNSFVTEGKIGEKALNITKQQKVLSYTSCMTGKKQMSYAFWVKVNTVWTTQWLDGIAWYSTDGTSAYYSRQEFYNNCTKVGTWFKGSPNSLSGYDFNPEKWTHIAATFDYNVGEAKFYLNGELKGTSNGLSTSDYCRGDFYIGDTGLDILENDVRIYDHALSPLEVKQISQGLILHYPLNRNGWGQENLVLNSQGVIIDKTQGNQNEYFAWNVGDSYKNITVETPVTISFDLEMQVNNITTYSGNLLTYNTNRRGPVQLRNSSYYFKDEYAIGENINKRIVLNTALIPRTTDINETDNFIEFYTGYNSGNMYKISNFKIELGNKATPWCPNSSDELATTLGLNDNIQYDTSGYGNNGTRTGTFSYDSDTPKYNVSTAFNGVDSCIQIGNWYSLFQNPFTINMWFKKDEMGSKGYETLFGGASGFEMDTKNGTSQVLSLYMTGTRGGSAYSPFNLKQWYMVTMVSDGINELYYVDGILVKTIEKKNMPNSNYYIGAWNSTTQQNFKGQISDFRIYTTALSAEDVKSLYNNSAYIDNQGNLYGAILREV